jgi:hypothetical protein
MTHPLATDFHDGLGMARLRRKGYARDPLRGRVVELLGLRGLTECGIDRVIVRVVGGQCARAHDIGLGETRLRDCTRERKLVQRERARFVGAENVHRSRTLDGR